MHKSNRQLSSLKLLPLLICGAFLGAQEVTSVMTPDVLRVGSHLSCHCGACRNTVGDCAMLHCSYCEPKRRRIYEMKQQGLSDDAIIKTFVQEEGIATLAEPPAQGLGPIVTWLGPGVALLAGFGIYAAYLRRNKKAPEVLAPVDDAVLERFRSQIDSELDDSPQTPSK